MCQPATSAAKPARRTNGMNFISQHKRLSLYLRDGLACVYCGSGVEDEVKLTADHVVPYSLGGGNELTNLVTACHKCNSSRGNRSVEDFAAAAAHYVGVDATCIINHVYACLSRPADAKTARQLVARRGSCLKVIQARDFQA